MTILNEEEWETFQELLKNPPPVPEWLKQAVVGERVGGTRRIGDLPERSVCQNREHNHPSMMVFQPGLYEHTCPGCGRSSRFRVDGFTEALVEHLRFAIKERDAACRTARAANVVGAWSWMPGGTNGENDLDSLSNDAVITMTAGTLRALLLEAATPSAGSSTSADAKQVSR